MPVLMTRLTNDQCQQICSGDNRTTSGYDVFQDLPHPLGPVHHVIPRESQDHPASGDTLVVPPTVAIEGQPVTVELEPLGLDNDPQGLVREINRPNHATCSRDLDLRLDAETRNLKTDRAEHRFDGSGAAPVRMSNHTRDTSAPTPRPKRHPTLKLAPRYSG